MKFVDARRRLRARRVGVAALGSTVWIMEEASDHR